MADPNFGRITSITLENFKGICEPVTIPLRPITLLFGKNSAGKSTILQAMLYARDILRTGEVNSDTVGLGGKAVDFGGFKRLVHRNGTNSAPEVKLRFDMEIGGLISYRNIDQERKEYSEDGLFESMNFESFNNTIDSILKNTNNIYVELVVKSDDSGLSKTCNIGIDGDQIFSIGWDPADAKRCNISINKNHPLAQKCGFLNEFTMSPEQAKDLPISSNENENWGQAFEVEDIIPSIGFPISFRRRQIPVKDHEQYNKNDYEDLLNKEFEDFLNRCIMRPLNILKNRLDPIRYIGPIREILPRHYSPRYTQDNEQWASGLAAWDVLMNPKLNENKSKELLENVNTALGKLQIDNELYKNEKGLVCLKEKSSNIEVDLCDIGVGISQIIPVVVGAIANDPNTDNRPSILAVEQPELHVHPAVQCELGDLFIRECKNQMFLIETHSEHLILRILRRILETNNKKIEEKSLALTPDDLSILIISKKDNTTQIDQMAVDKNGEILTQWPGGFFEERFTELYGI